MHGMFKIDSKTLRQTVYVLSTLHAQGIQQIKTEVGFKIGNANHYVQKKNYMQYSDNRHLPNTDQTIKVLGLQRKDKSFHLGAKRSDQ